MQTIPSVHMETASDPTRRLLEIANAEHGRISNMLRAMAHSHKTLDGFLYFAHALESSTLDPVLAEQIALTVAQVDECEYSLAEHAARARQLSLSEDDILAAREGRLANKKTEAVLRFARSLARRTGEYGLYELRHAGYSDREIVDIIACVGLNVFANLFNLAAKPENDFRKASAAVHAA